jgi:hypothetical protein
MFSVLPIKYHVNQTKYFLVSLKKYHVNHRCFPHQPFPKKPAMVHAVMESVIRLIDRKYGNSTRYHKET